MVIVTWVYLYYLEEVKAKAFRAIKDRITARVQGWERKLLSSAGKAFMIQAVAQSIPLYVMSCFRLPKGFILVG